MKDYKHWKYIYVVNWKCILNIYKKLLSEYVHTFVASTVCYLAAAIDQNMLATKKITQKCSNFLAAFNAACLDAF